jgi:hypothetical protein
VSLTTALLINFGVLALVLAGDLGRRRLTTHRVLRPLVASGVVTALYAGSVPAGGPGLAFVLGVTAVGAVLGLVSVRLVRAERTAAGTFTVCGLAYAAFWTTASVLRFGFTYGMQHWFGADVARVLAEHQIPLGSLTDAIIGMSLAMVLARSLTLLVKTRTARPARFVAAHA